MADLNDRLSVRKMFITAVDWMEMFEKCWLL